MIFLSPRSRKNQSPGQQHLHFNYLPYGTLLGSMFLVSCASTQGKKGLDDEQYYLTAITEAENLLAERGTTTVSPIALEKPENSDFKFALNKSVTDHFNKFFTSQERYVCSHSTIVTGRNGGGIAQTI